MAKIVILENLGKMDKKPMGIGFHYELEFVECEGKKFYRRNKIHTSTGEVSSRAYSLKKDTKKWIGTLWDLLQIK